MPKSVDSDSLALQNRAIEIARELARICSSIGQPEAAELIGDAIVILAADLNLQTETYKAGSAK